MDSFELILVQCGLGLMKEKKTHEVGIMGGIVRSLLQEAGVNQVIDLGSGKV